VVWSLFRISPVRGSGIELRAVSVSTSAGISPSILLWGTSYRRILLPWKQGQMISWVRSSINHQ